ncbi:DUF2065 family protein [Undibacterium macrobrachii]|uniref:DUF2065 family protein n=1 Tax=Undibacterium macrobrachii TaxID=1119058 RepID=UPI00357136F3
MLYSSIIRLFGWVFIVSTIVMLALPWKWHQRFSRKVVPYANQYLRPIGIVSIGIGFILVWSLFPVPRR